jgi:hypothetical protein
VITITVDEDGCRLEGTTRGDQEERACIERPWVWSRTVGAWVLPRSLRPSTRDRRILWTVEALGRIGREVEVIREGPEQTAQERRDASAERLEVRAERHQARADRLNREATASRERWDQVAHALNGQPILIGHYSENRIRRLYDRMHDATRKYLDQEEEARRRAQLAEGIRQRLDSGETVRSLLSRIERKTPELRSRLRYLENSQGWESERRDAVIREAELLADEIELDRAALAELEAQGAKVWGPADFTKGDHARVHGMWRRVVRVNKTTLTCDTGFGYELRTPYRNVSGRKPAGAGSVSDG